MKETIVARIPSTLYASQQDCSGSIFSSCLMFTLNYKFTHFLLTLTKQWPVSFCSHCERMTQPTETDQHSRHLTRVPPLNPPAMTTWQLRKFTAPSCSCPSILFYQRAPHMVSIRERCLLCYMGKARKIEMDYYWSFSNVIMYWNVFKWLCVTMMEGGSPKWNWI